MWKETLDNKIEYEYQLFEALSRSGVTPRPYHYDIKVDSLGRGALHMKYLPSTPLITAMIC
jgi:hypothetical protein